DDLVFADDLFDDQSDLATGDVADHHAVVAVYGLDGVDAELRVEANDFSDDVANLGQQFAADLLDIFLLQAANLLDESERQGEDILPATDEQRLRDDQRQRDLEGEARPLPGDGVDVNLAVQGSEVGADDVEPDAASGEFGLAGSSREAGVEEKL